MVDRDEIDAIVAEIDARHAARDAFIASHPGEPAIEMPSRFDATTMLYVTRDALKPEGWRVTWFFRGEPHGHTERATWEEATCAAIDDYHGDISRAKVAR